MDHLPLACSGLPQFHGKSFATPTGLSAISFVPSAPPTPREGVAFYSDYPTIQQDLMARRYWLYRWGRVNAERLNEDVNFFDIKAAGYWAWCVSQWIGLVREMTQPKSDGIVLHEDRIPSVDSHLGGRGVQRQRSFALLNDQIPAHDGKGTGGRGVQRQRKTFALNDQIPSVPSRIDGGRGVQRQKSFATLRDQIPHVKNVISGSGTQRQRNYFPESSLGPSPYPDGTHLRPWFAALAVRLANAIVLNRSWESALTPSLLCGTASSPANMKVAIFLDPPYRVGHDQRAAYNAATNEDGARDVARESYEWAVANGEKYRIGYCSATDDFPVPDGWTYSDLSMAGVRNKQRDRTTDRIIFSPACLEDAQLGMFDEGEI